MASRRNRHPAPPASGSKSARYRFIVSACLAGARCTFKGRANTDERVARLFHDGAALAVCPELAGGLGIPRERCEIRRGDGSDVLKGRSGVLSESGRPLTREYIKGSLELAALAKRLGIRRAVLKSDSPACGAGRIYDGTFSRRFRSGDGVFAAALRREGLRLYTERAKGYG